MDKDTATKMFARDVEDLRRDGGHFRVRDVRLVEPLVATFLLRHAGKGRRVVVRATAKYPLEPAETLFVNPDKLADEAPEWWPAGVGGLNAGSKMVCSYGFAAGHRAHPKWPVATRKNQLEHVVNFLCGIVKPELWPEEP